MYKYIYIYLYPQTLCLAVAKIVIIYIYIFEFTKPEIHMLKSPIVLYNSTEYFQICIISIEFTCYFQGGRWNIGGLAFAADHTVRTSGGCMWWFRMDFFLWADVYGKIAKKTRLQGSVMVKLLGGGTRLYNMVSCDTS